MRKVRSTSISNRSTILVSRCFSSGFSAIANAAISRNGSLTSARLGLAGIFAMHWEQLVERDQQRVSAGDDRRVGQRMAKLVTRPSVDYSSDRLRCHRYGPRGLLVENRALGGLCRDVVPASCSRRGCPRRFWPV